jgi:NAD(P)-dependent dehydrogenase (short-subunit alcohol dehydrogenase family)
MHIVITGANRGIGLAFAQHYSSQNNEITAICRTSSRDLEATKARVITGIDVAESDAADKIKTALNNQPIDLLINNAGILRRDILSNLHAQDIQLQLLVNAIAPLMITQALLGNLAKGSKVALITSRMGSIEDNGTGGYYGYRMSKAALNAAGKNLALDLKSQGVSIAILHPGFVQTDMVNSAGDISAATAVERLAQRINELNSKNSGTFWHSNGEILPW